MTIQKAAKNLQLLSFVFDFSVTSWFRSAKRNKALKGAPNSPHLTGNAVDVVLDDAKDSDHFVRFAERMGFKCVVESDHIHVRFN